VNFNLHTENSRSTSVEDAGMKLSLPLDDVRPNVRKTVKYEMWTGNVDICLGFNEKSCLFESTRL
jgi:hypothetical protein